MRRLLCLAICTLSMLTVSASASNPVEQSDLLKAREAVWRSWFANDVKALEELLPPETLTISSGEEQWKNKTDVLKEAADFQAGGGKLLTLEFPRTEIQRFGDVAIIFSKYRYEIETGGKRSATSGRVTEIFVLSQGKWLNFGWHTDTEK